MDSVVYYTDRPVSVADLVAILERDGWRYSIHPTNVYFVTIYLSVIVPGSQEPSAFHWYLEPVTLGEILDEGDGFSDEEAERMRSYRPISLFEIQYRAITLCPLTDLVASFMAAYGGWMFGPDKVDYQASDVSDATYTSLHTGKVFVDCKADRPVYFK